MFNRKYKKGIQDAAKAYEAFGEKQEKALEFILEELRSSNIDIKTDIDELDGNIDALYEDLSSKELAKLYTVYTPFDIKNLEENERLFLVGALIRLTVDKTPTDEQQNYLRSIQKYLEIKEPPFGVDLTAIENIDNMNAQKAIYQSVLEYLILQDGESYDETELQQEFLDSFNLNSKNREYIAEHVEILCSATGALGLSEKYGYVIEDESIDITEEENASTVVFADIIPEVAENIADNVIYDHNGSRCFISDYVETNNYIVKKCESPEDYYEKNGHYECYYLIDKHTGKSKILAEDGAAEFEFNLKDTVFKDDKILLVNGEDKAYIIDLNTMHKIELPVEIESIFDRYALNDLYFIKSSSDGVQVFDLKTMESYILLNDKREKIEAESITVDDNFLYIICNEENYRGPLDFTDTFIIKYDLSSRIIKEKVLLDGEFYGQIFINGESIYYHDTPISDNEGNLYKLDINNLSKGFEKVFNYFVAETSGLSFPEVTTKDELFFINEENQICMYSIKENKTTILMSDVNTDKIKLAKLGDYLYFNNDIDDGQIFRINLKDLTISYAIP